MATVTKDFRIKSGLVVEGATGTIDGSDIITADKITSGTNVGVTVSYVDGVVNFEVEASEAVTELAQDAVAAALAAGTHTNITVDYDDANNAISLTGAVTYTDADARNALSVDATGPLTYNSTSGEFDLSTGTGLEVAVTGELKVDETWLDTEIADGAVAAIYTEPGTPLTYNSGEIGFTLGTFNGGLGLDVASYGLEIDRTVVDTWYDAAGAAATAETNANNYTDSEIADAIAGIPAAVLSIAGDTGTDSVTLVTDTLTFVGDANLDVDVTDNTVTVSSNATVDPTIDTIVLRGNDGEGSSIIQSDVFATTGGIAMRGTQIGSGSGNLVIYDDTANIYQNGTFKGSLNVNNGTITNLSDPTNAQDAATKTYVDSAVAGIVDGAPALLDTLNELAAAIGDDENYATTVAGLIADKQNTLTAGDNISIVSDTISVTGLDSTDISDFNTAALSATASAYDAAGAAQDVQDNLDTHTTATSAHGVTGDIVGTSDSQTLSNKMISGNLEFDSSLTTIGVNQSTSDLDITNGFGGLDISGTARVDITSTNGAVGISAEGGDVLIGTSALNASVNINQSLFVSGTTGLAYYGFNQNGESENEIATVGHVAGELDSYLNSTSGSEGTTILYVQDYVATAIETGDATATPTYLALDINSVAKQVAVEYTLVTSGVEDKIYSFPKADYRSAKFLVRSASGTHTEISEILLTLDTSDNVAITEYAVVGTNGSLAELTAAVNGSWVELRGTPTNANTVVSVYGTLLA